MITLLAAMVMAPTPDFASLMKEVDETRLRATVERLATWNTRNTSSPLLSEAADWVMGEFKKVPGLQVELFKYQVHKGARIPADREVVEVVATLPGKTDRRVLVGGHLDTINMTERNLTASIAARAPGADDDGSAVAMTLELARIMSTRSWNQTLVFCIFSGEEQGLLGSKALADFAKAQNWKIDGVQSNDIIGSSSNLEGEHDDSIIRVFSEEPGVRPGRDAEPDSGQSREMARFIELVTREAGIRAGRKQFGVKLVFRRDRFGRGGDHTSFNQDGFTAIRFCEPHEEYKHQHTGDDLPQFLDWKYLANVARVNLNSMAHLASAGAQPTTVRVSPRQGYDARITWQGQPNTNYVVYWRETTSPVWEGSKAVGAVSEVTLPKMSKDDLIFAVGSENGIPVEAK